MCSPYSATILISSPQEGKLTIKTNLIFEDFIGIDIHQKVILMKEASSSVIHKYGMKKLSLPQPSNVCIIDHGNDSTSQARTDLPHMSKKSRREEDSMPTFRLLDEEWDEGEPAVENEDDDCKIITEGTVFDHICQKAKNLPSFVTVTSSNECSPSVETIALLRKRTRDRQLGIDTDIEVLDATEQVNTSDILHEETRTLTGERIFEHIRKKAKTFPAVDEIKTLRTKSSFASRDQAFPDNQTDQFDSYGYNMYDFEDAPSYQVPEDNVIVIDSKHMKGGSNTKHEDLFGSSVDTYGHSTKMSSPSVTSMAKKETQFPGSSIETYAKQLYSPSLSGRQCCSLATAGETREAETFLGFKSVFSFL